MEKIAFFDFNGTLTKTNNSFDFLLNGKKFGFKKFVYKYFGFIPFIRKVGLKITGRKLKRKNLSENFVHENSHKIELKKDLTQVFTTLKNLGYKIIIISGGFKEVIEIALKNNLQLVDEIFANNLKFQNGKIVDIQVNPIDFNGKKKTILNYINKKNALLAQSIFVCNSFNDKKALSLPLKKFCFEKNIKYKDVIIISSLSEILKFVK